VVHYTERKQALSSRPNKAEKSKAYYYGNQDQRDVHRNRCPSKQFFG